jgi:hypothetical protein
MYGGGGDQNLVREMQEGGEREKGGRNVHHRGERERERGGLTVGRDNGGGG